MMALGHEVVIEPLLEIVYQPGSLLDLIGVQAVLLTSANGARAVALRTTARNVAVVAVAPLRPQRRAKRALSTSLKAAAQASTR